VQRITSRNNERLREVARLIESSRDRRKSGRCVLEGVHLIDVYTTRIGAPETLVVVDDAVGDAEVARIVGRVPPARVVAVPRAVFTELAVLPPEIGALAVVTAPHAPSPPPGQFCLVLEDVQDPGNVGSIIRTAAAAGVDQVVLSRHCAFAWSPKALRAGQGAQFLTTLVEHADLDAWVAAFRAAGGRLVATVVRDAPSVYATDLAGRVALAIGSEGSGLSPALRARADVRVRIPMASDSESLNAGAAAAVLLFEAARQRSLGAATARR